MSRTVLASLFIAVLSSCSMQVTSYTPQPEPYDVVDGLIEVGSTRIYARPGRLSGFELLEIRTGYLKQFEISSKQAANMLAIKTAMALEQFEQTSSQRLPEKTLYVTVTDIRLKFDTDIVSWQPLNQTVVSHVTIETGDEIVRGFRSTGEFHRVTGERHSIGDEAVDSLIGETLADAANQALADPLIAAYIGIAPGDDIQ